MFSSSTTGSRWIVTPRPNPEARLRLFCIPYAGGSASVYRPWTTLLPSDVELCAIQLPGRETRMREPLLTDAHETVVQLTEEAAPLLEKPYVIFGHSLGALLAFEWTRHIRALALPGPQQLFVSGRVAPQVPEVRDPAMYTLSDAEFIDGLRKFGGTPESVLGNKDLMRMVLPLLRADFQMNEAYQYAEEPPLDCPLSVFSGTKDDLVPFDEATIWREQTTSTYALRRIPGGHFFIHDARDLFMRIFLHDIRKLARSLPQRAAAEVMA